MTNTLEHVREQAVTIPPYDLYGDLVLPNGATGLVIFAHGSGSSRRSSRNRYVARQLNRGRLATLLMDLLTEKEERIDARTQHLRFDIGMLAERLGNAAQWAGTQQETRDLMIGYFGASTGAGAALVAAGDHPERIAAVVSRGGRPDLAGHALTRVEAPTLLIVGGEDHAVIEMNTAAIRALRCEKRLVVVPGATHLFEEPGTLEQVSELAREWFQNHFVLQGEARAQ
jgi:putative phosphoribosyl transferase